MKNALMERLQAGGKLPTPPGVVLRLLELTRRADATVREIAGIIAMDPGLSAKILRFVNSPMAGVAREVASLPQAVALMGVRGVKMMALSFSVISPWTRRTAAGFDHQQFVIQSLACGTAAKVLSGQVKIGAPQEAFLAGLLSQIGRSTLASALPEEYAQVLKSARRVPDDLPDLERAAFGETYATVGGQLLRSWGIPETLCRAVEMFRSLETERDPPPLARILSVAELAAGLVCDDDEDHSPYSERFVQTARRILGLDDDQCLSAIQAVARETDAARVLFEIPEARMRPVEEIESEVRERITELSLAMHLENQNMAQQQEELLRRATTDPLTGVGNRAAFDARLSLELERAVRSGTAVALLMIDVDKFKTFNDTYGHLAGDRVLQAVARTLDENIRKVDYVARFGGEEFAVIAPGASKDGAVLLAERLRQSVDSMPVAWEGKTLGITISVGVGLLIEVTDTKEAAVALVRSADEQLYAAKCSGRNRVGFPRPVAAAPLG